MPRVEVTPIILGHLQMDEVVAARVRTARNLGHSVRVTAHPGCDSAVVIASAEVYAVRLCDGGHEVRDPDATECPVCDTGLPDPAACWPRRRES